MLLYLLFKIICMAVLMAYITPMKYSLKKSVVIIAVFHGVIWIANYAAYVYLGADFLAVTFLLTAGIPGFICFNIIAKYRGLRVLFSLLTVIIFAMLASFIGNLADFYYTSTVLQLTLKFVSYILIIIFVVKVFKKPYFKILQTLEKGWGLLCLIPALLINMVSLLQYFPAPIQDRPENIPLVFFTFALTFVFYCILYFNFENISQFFQLRRDREVLAVQTELYKKEYLGMVDNINANKLYRHDIKHHIIAMNTFLNDSNIEEAKKYIGSLDESLSRIVVERYCENYVLNVILSSYINRAKNEQIKVVRDLNIPENIAIDNIELGLIFANALENAINACQKIEDPINRSITIVCKVLYGQMYIGISNPFVGEVLFDGEFPVSKTEGHGMGSRSIAAIAQKYEGSFFFLAQDSIFKTTVSLKC